MTTDSLPGPAFSVAAVGRRLAELRRAMRWSQKELATRIGRSVNSLSRWENGTQEMGISDAVALAKAFGLSVSALVSDGALNPAVHELAAQVGQLMERVATLSDEMRALKQRDE